MIVNKRIQDYIHMLEPEYSEILIQLEEEAHQNKVPVIQKETQSLLKTIIALKQPVEVLEIGTAIGFSAILMSEYLRPESKITTIERNKKRIQTAKENFLRTGNEKKIHLLEGDAESILKKLEGPYDLIFLDSAKAQYIVFLPEIIRLLSINGVLLTDNILQEGSVIESKYGIIKRNRTIHQRVREYLWTIKHTESLSTSILPVGDGVAVSVKLGTEDGGTYEKTRIVNTSK